MSELKAYCPYANRDGFYHKSDVDKVIEEKDEKIENLEEYIKELQKATDSAWSKVNAMYDELTHVKLKRCLAMAKLCLREYLNCNKYKITFWLKWRKRCLTLAEKFKEAK